ncbi:hypothetical protein UlMin_022423 [Ulmus minor]
MTEEEQLLNSKTPKSKEKKRKSKRVKQQLVEETAEADEEQQAHEGRDESGKGKKKKKKKHLGKENIENEEGQAVSREAASEGDGLSSDYGNKDRKEKSLKEDCEVVGGLQVSEIGVAEEGNVQDNDDESDIKKKKRKRGLLKEAAKARNRGVCYLSRIPPLMNPLKLRQLLSQLGDIQRIYLTPENPAFQLRRKSAGGFRGQQFLEGWIEFSDKRVAKRVADMLNGEQIGGKKRSAFYYDLWNIKYLSKFKWDDLTEEIAAKNATREQKLALEISAAKKERDFYLARVDQSRALSSIEDRLKKKQKLQQESGADSDLPVSIPTKVIRKVPQKQPIADKAAETKASLSKDILAGVFGGS